MNGSINRATTHANAQVVIDLKACGYRLARVLPRRFHQYRTESLFSPRQTRGSAPEATWQKLSSALS